MVTAVLMPRTSKAPPKAQLRQLGRRLREIRGKRTQEEIARPIGISAGYVSNLESGRYQPTTEVIEGYEKHWGADYNELAELAGLLRRRKDTEWTPPPDKAPQVRTLVEHLTSSQLSRIVRHALDLYDVQLERTIDELPDDPEPESQR
jgi:transcriptional regulator with XRE-family HTH domain